jgi:beta-mannosidase
MRGSRGSAVGVGVGVFLAAAGMCTPARADAPASVAHERRALDGPWSFHRVTPRKDSPEPWLPATVPGCVHTDLFANGKIGDPFYRLNEKDQQWIDRESWEYRTILHADAALLGHARVELVFAGLDTFAEVFVNGQTVLFADNMFRSWRADVKAQLHAGDNVVVVRFRSPIEQVQGSYRALGYRLPAANDQSQEMVSMWARKAPYHYGWDWGPRFVTSGIWRPVALETWDQARIDDVQIFQNRLDAAAADLTVKVRIAAASAGRARLAVRIAGGAVLAQADVDVPAGVHDWALPARIERPELWWPNGLGAQRLYTLETTLATAAGTALDARPTRIGLRTLEVVHQRDADGKSFFIKVNGAPVFMKGANWIPADSFNARVTPERYRFLLESAKTTNMNMLRVWGGGIYEDDQFYALCDELGLLVWHDFMFACSMYPGDDAFVANVEKEAGENVRRIRNHPSLALWAGNNENEAAWKGWGWPAKFNLSRKAQDRIGADYKRMFHQILPGIVAAEDPGRFYTRSSPSANEDNVPANRKGWGDMHFWGVWHSGADYTSYADNVSRFMSEFGFQSFPELASVARYTAREDWDIGSPVMLSHQRHPRGNALIRTYMDRDFRRPKDFASFLYVGQVLQATVIKFAAEAHRRAMGRNWGSLYWQLDDCWPVASWSSIDYYGRWKAQQYAARQFFAPVLVSPVEEKGVVNVWAISDRRSDAPAHLTVRLVDFQGRELWRKEQDVTLAANASRVLLSMPRAQALGGAADPTRVVLVAELGEPGQKQALSRNLLSFVRTKDLELPVPELRLEVGAGTGGALAVTVTAPVFARNVYLTAGDPGAAAGPAAIIDGHFDDNFFDLLPGETRTVLFHPAQPTTPAALQAALHATTIANTY